MFHNRISRINTHLPNKLRGSALVMALFIMVVMMMLGLTLTRLLSSSAETIAYEVLGTRAYAAAQTGAQWRLQQLFPLSPAVNVHCDGDATNTTDNNKTSHDELNNPLPNISNAKGLPSCRVISIVCDDFKHDDVTYYTVTSIGECDIDGTQTSRTIEVQARSL